MTNNSDLVIYYKRRPMYIVCIACISFAIKPDIILEDFLQLKIIQMNVRW